MGLESVRIKDNLTINRYNISHIEGGFNEEGKGILVKDIARLHSKESKHVNESINCNRKRFRDYIDIIDLKGTEFEVGLIDHEIFTQNSINRAKNIYLLSERGYSKLLKIMDDDKSWEMYDILLDDYFHLRSENYAFRKYSRSNNRFTTKCLLNLEGQKETETDFMFLINNTVRNETERLIEEIGIKAGVIAAKAKIPENSMSNWRTRRTSLDMDSLEKITNVISRFKDFLE